MLTFKDVTYTYHTKQGETTAVKDMNFSVKDGQFVSVIGPSGCGKTTILSIAAGLLLPSSGEVKRDTGEFGYMLQRDALFPWRIRNIVRDKQRGLFFALYNPLNVVAYFQPCLVVQRGVPLADGGTKHFSAA